MLYKRGQYLRIAAQRKPTSPGTFGAFIYVPYLPAARQQPRRLLSTFGTARGCAGITILLQV